MATIDIPRRLVGEFLGTALLLAVVIGSGVMGERLAAVTIARALSDRFAGIAPASAAPPATLWP